MPNDERTYRYQFEGAFDKTATDKSVQVTFKEGSFSDRQGATAVDEVEQFSWFAPAQPNEPAPGGSALALLANPRSGAVVNLQSLNIRRFIDVPLRRRATVSFSGLTVTNCACQALGQLISG